MTLGDVALLLLRLTFSQKRPSVRAPMTNSEWVRYFGPETNYKNLPGSEPTSPRTWGENFTAVLNNRKYILIKNLQLSYSLSLLVSKCTSFVVLMDFIGWFHDSVVDPSITLKVYLTGGELTSRLMKCFLVRW